MIKVDECTKVITDEMSAFAMRFMYKALGIVHIFADGRLLGIEAETI